MTSETWSYKTFQLLPWSFGLFSQGKVPYHFKRTLKQPYGKKLICQYQWASHVNEHTSKQNLKPQSRLQVIPAPSLESFRQHRVEISHAHSALSELLAHGNHEIINNC